MKKRTFLKALLASGGMALTAQRPLQQKSPALTGSTTPPPAPATSASTVPELIDSSVEEELALGRLQQNELHPQFVHQEHHDHAHDHASTSNGEDTVAFEADLTQATNPDEQQRVIDLIVGVK
jgi:7-keto-8-aminopelargonate synthetase-like enzyme